MQQDNFYVCLYVENRKVDTSENNIVQKSLKKYFLKCKIQATAYSRDSNSTHQV